MGIENFELRISQVIKLPKWIHMENVATLALARDQGKGGCKVAGL
jgi:hypothetical protein